MGTHPTDNETTTLNVTRSLHERLDELKPYSSMSFGEFIEEILDVYERQLEEEDR